MSEFVEVAKTSDVPLGSFRTVVVAGRKVILFRTANGFFALDHTCPHRGGPLGEGDLIDDEIVCPWHLWGFNVETGISPGNPEVAVLKHAVRVEGDKILVRLSQSPPADGSQATP